MSQLILIHGGFGHPRSWQAVLPALERLGHSCLAVDLPVSQVGASVDVYTDVICRTMTEHGIGDEAILIGHSLAGTLLPRVALRRTVGGLIYVCPAIPPRNPAEHDENLAAFGAGLTGKFKSGENDIVTVEPDDAIEIFYHDVAPETARLAAEARRPQWAPAMSTTYAPLESLPDVPVAAIICTDDRVLQVDRLRRLIQSRLHVDPVELPGGHAPHLSQPEEFARVVGGMIQSFPKP